MQQQLQQPQRIGVWSGSQTAAAATEDAAAVFDPKGTMLLFGWGSQTVAAAAAHAAAAAVAADAAGRGRTSHKRCGTNNGRQREYLLEADKLVPARTTA